MKMVEKVKVGDRVARVKTRKIISKPTDEKDVPFEVVEVKGSMVIGEDSNVHLIDGVFVKESDL